MLSVSDKNQLVVGDDTAAPALPSMHVAEKQQMGCREGSRSESALPSSTAGVTRSPLVRARAPSPKFYEASFLATV